MKRNLSRKIAALPDDMPVSSEVAEQLQTLWQFDEHVTAPLHGFKDAADYYQRCSGLPRLADVTVPLRVIHAKDDPFMTEAVIPTEPLPPHIQYDLCQYGGHVGFVTGSWRQPDFWLEKTVPEWFSKVLDPRT